MPVFYYVPDITIHWSKICVVRCFGIPVSFEVSHWSLARGLSCNLWYESSYQKTYSCPRYANNEIHTCKIGTTL